MISFWTNPVFIRNLAVFNISKTIQHFFLLVSEQQLHETPILIDNQNHKVYRNIEDK